MRLCRLLDPAFAIGERGVDIGAASLCSDPSSKFQLRAGILYAKS
jgi:hypothetical protein